MAEPDPPVFWNVRVEMSGWRSWSPWLRRRLKREIASDDRVVRVAKLSPMWYPAVQHVVPLHPFVVVDVAAVGQGEAFRFASAAVGAALKRLGVDSTAEPWILHTDEEVAPEEAYEAARRKHRARWRRPGT